VASKIPIGLTDYYKTRIAPVHLDEYWDADFDIRTEWKLIFCVIDDEKNLTKFFWLRIFSQNISYSSVHDCIPFWWQLFYLLLNEQNVLLFKKVNIKIYKESINKNNLTIFTHDTWQRYSGDTVTIEKCKVTCTSLWTNEKAVITFKWRLLHPNLSVAWALITFICEFTIS
jgi:hypothetical protein